MSPVPTAGRVTEEAGGAVYGPGGRIRVVQSAGHADAQIKAANGDWLSIHSPDDPHAEACARLDASLNGQTVPPIVALIGVGIGYIVEELTRRRPDVRIVAVELVPGLAALCRPFQTWRDLETSGRLVLVADPSQPIPAPAWPAAAIVEKPLAVVEPVLARSESVAYEQARASLKQFFYEQRANAEARQRLAGLYFNNTIDNLPALAQAADVSALDGIAAGKPLVLIGAGPSLDRLLPALAASRERGWYVALDTALKPLVNAGIMPDIVVSVDPSPLNGRHLFNIPVRARPWLVAETSVDPRALAAFAGRTFACRIGRADPWPWLETLNVTATRLQVWGSVLTASCDLVRRMQAVRVIFAGMDLAYTDGQPYCRGTAFEEDWRAQQVRDQLPSLQAVWERRIAEVAVPDVDRHGRSVRTAPQMVAFRNWVRTFIAASNGCRFINVSDAGILHGPGIEQLSLTQALSGLSGRIGAERRLRKAAIPAFVEGGMRIASAIEALLKTDPEDPAHPSRPWSETIPNFNMDHARRRLLHAERRLRAQQGVPAMTATESDWVDVPYDPANFRAKKPLVWRVNEQNVATYAYRVQGKTMTLAFKINHSALAGMPTNELHLKIPGGFLPNRGMANPIWICSHATKECGYATVHPGRDSVVLLRATEQQFPIEPRDFFVFGQLTFEVQ